MANTTTVSIPAVETISPQNAVDFSGIADGTVTQLKIQNASKVNNATFTAVSGTWSLSGTIHANQPEDAISVNQDFKGSDITVFNTSNADADLAVTVLPTSD